MTYLNAYLVCIIFLVSVKNYKFGSDLTDKQLWIWLNGVLFFSARYAIRINPLKGQFFDQCVTALFF